MLCRSDCSLFQLLLFQLYLNTSETDIEQCLDVLVVDVPAFGLHVRSFRSSSVGPLIIIELGPLQRPDQAFHGAFDEACLLAAQNAALPRIS